ncbi:MAG: metallophosphoesterase [Acidobacteria bacterium]|nr:metallophosphoesterase [Acidobacteriota bacterium]
MAHLQTVRDPDLSLWQSAVDEVVASNSTRSQSTGEAAVIQRPDHPNFMEQSAAADVCAEVAGSPIEVPPPGGPVITEGVGAFVNYCSKMARDYAGALIRGDHAAADAARLAFSEYQQCDNGWLEVAAKYAEFQGKAALGAKIPYQVYKNIDTDYVFDDKLPADATVAIVADWGTGQQAAIHVLAQIARKKPDVVIHLGDIYYSCTDFEVTNYFLNIWKQYFDPAKIPSLTLSGNHDMYSGGQPYYNLIKQLGWESSYNCLRNDHWQLIMLDTGLHDRTPGSCDPTYLEDTEVAWVKRRYELASKARDGSDLASPRKSILLSHHQLYTRYDHIIDGRPELAINPHLQDQLGSVLSQTAAWLWGHEHDMVIFKQTLGVLGRCIGNGAMPVLASQAHTNPTHPEIQDEGVRPTANGPFLSNGYAILKLNGPTATIDYYSDADPSTPVWTDHL